jgi:hypothetical protein
MIPIYWREKISEDAMTMLFTTALLGMTGDQWFSLLQELLGGIGLLIALFLIAKYLWN